MHTYVYKTARVYNLSRSFKAVVPLIDGVPRTTMFVNGRPSPTRQQCQGSAGEKFPFPPFKKVPRRLLPWASTRLPEYRDGTWSIPPQVAGASPPWAKTCSISPFETPYSITIFTTTSPPPRIAPAPWTRNQGNKSLFTLLLGWVQPGRYIIYPDKAASSGRLLLT